MLGGAVRDQGEFALREQRNQDVTDVLRGQLGFVENPGHRMGL